jgi:hypothetical protein
LIDRAVGPAPVKLSHHSTTERRGAIQPFTTARKDPLMKTKTNLHAGDGIHIFPGG